MKSRVALTKCAVMMVKMLELGFTKDHLPKLEELFWQTHNRRTGEVNRIVPKNIRK